MSEEEKAREPELRKISQRELDEILRAHAKWVEEGLREEIPGQARLAKLNLRGLVLSDANLEGARFYQVDLSGAKIRRSNLKNTVFEGVNFDFADLREVNLAWVILKECALNHANLAGAQLNNAFIQKTRLKFANLHGARLDDASLEAARLNNADLRGAGFDYATLTSARLNDANLQGSRLYNAKLQRASLVKANLTDANLTQADLSGANLTGATLKGVILRHTNLSGALHLDLRQMAGVDLYTTILPADVAKFEGLKTVDEAAKKGSHLFTILLLCCLFAWLTVGFGVIAPKDGSYLLPFFQNANMKESGFLLLAPAFILGLFFYFQMYLQRLWEQLALMPAIFPDGSPLDKKAHPWLPIGYVRAHVKVLRANRPPMSKLQTVLIQAMVFWAAPLTIGLFWWSYLDKRYWPETTYHSLLTLAAVWISAAFTQQARLTLRREEDPAKQAPAQKIWTPDRIFDGLSMPGLLAVFMTLIVLGLGWAKHFS